MSELWQWRIRAPFSAFSERALKHMNATKKKDLHFHDGQRNRKKKSHIVFTIRCGFHFTLRSSENIASLLCHLKHTHTQSRRMHSWWTLRFTHKTLRKSYEYYTGLYSLGLFISKSERWKKAPRVNRKEKWETRKYHRQIRMKLMLRLRTSSIRGESTVVTTRFQWIWYFVELLLFIAHLNSTYAKQISLLGNKTREKRLRIDLSWFFVRHLFFLIVLCW